MMLRTCVIESFECTSAADGELAADGPAHAARSQNTYVHDEFPPRVADADPRWERVEISNTP